MCNMVSRLMTHKIRGSLILGMGSANCPDGKGGSSPPNKFSQVVRGPMFRKSRQLRAGVRALEKGINALLIGIDRCYKAPASKDEHFGDRPRELLDQHTRPKEKRPQSHLVPATARPCNSIASPMRCFHDIVLERRADCEPSNAAIISSR
jgi:hypothetical protein